MLALTLREEFRGKRLKGTAIEPVSYTHLDVYKRQVLSIAGKVATVDCGDTFTSEDGRTVRSIPLANLAPARLPVAD